MSSPHPSRRPAHPPSVFREALLFLLGAMLVPGVAWAQCGGGGGGASRRGEWEASRVVTKYDKEEDVTLVSVGPVGGAKQLRVSAAFTCAGKETCRPGVVQLVLVSEYRYPRLEEDHGLRLIADETPLDLPTPRYRAERGRAGVVELVTVNLPVATFLGLARAEQVGYRIGSLTGSLSGEQRAAFRSMAERIEALP